MVSANLAHLTNQLQVVNVGALAVILRLDPLDGFMCLFDSLRRIGIEPNPFHRLFDLVKPLLAFASGEEVSAAMRHIIEVSGPVCG